MINRTSGFELAAYLLPKALRGAAMSLPPQMRSGAEEFRLREGRAATVLLRGKEIPLANGLEVIESDLAAVLEIATGASAYSAISDIRRGFLTARGGCRIGLCGSAVMGAGGAVTMKSLSSLAIRIPSEQKGCADNIFPELKDKAGENLLIISPPGGGKTTLLRELVRLYSASGKRVAVADERGEIGAVWEGKAQFDLGPHTDILSGFPKAEAAMMLLRSMNPELIAIDEITAPEDVTAAAGACNCGVSLIATAHGTSAEELTGRPIYRKLLGCGIFGRAVIIERRAGEREYRLEEIHI